MSSQWLIVLMFVSFLQLAIADPIKRVGTDDGTEQNGYYNPNNEINSMGIDSSYYYRLTNAYSGRRLALDVENDGSNYALKMPATAVAGDQGRRSRDARVKAFASPSWHGGVEKEQSLTSARRQGLSRASCSGAR
jgi:hypothetical protein